MAAEAWLTRAAGEIWAGLGDAADRDLLTLARFGLGVRPVEIPSLTLDAVREWLLRRAPDMRIEGADRELQGCLVLPHGQAYIFLDARDPVAERRFTLAHEIAHLWLDVLQPERRLTAELGKSVVDVLEGRRTASTRERLYALLHGLPLQRRVHLLHRDARLGLVDPGVLQAEAKADRLALELLAPEEEAIRRLPPRSEWPGWLQEASSALGECFNLPQRVAESYAQRLAREVGAGPSFWQRLG